MKVGEIYLGQIPDPNGQPVDEPHPAMILTEPLTSNPDEVIHVVGISTKFSDPPPPHWIKLPYSNDSSRPARTGLKQRCVLKCNWIVPVQVKVLIKLLGRMPGKELYQAMPQINQIVAQKKILLSTARTSSAGSSSSGAAPESGRGKTE